jgi:hypothetical protein
MAAIKKLVRRTAKVALAAAVQTSRTTTRSKVQRGRREREKGERGREGERGRGFYSHQISAGRASEVAPVSTADNG